MTGLTTQPTKPRRRRGCLITLLIVAALCGAGLVRACLGFIENGRRPTQIGREVRAKLMPGMTLREALVLSYAAGRNEPETAMGNPLALVWAHCTSATPRETGKISALDGTAWSTRVFLFVAPRGSASPPASLKGGLPPTVFMDQPGGSPTDTEAAVIWLTQCRDVEIVLESGFWGSIYLPVTVSPDGRLDTIGEIYTAAK